MATPASEISSTGIEVFDLRDDPVFQGRRVHSRDPALQMNGLQRIARAFVESPSTILQELVNAAVELCGADSAGISIEKDGRTDQDYYHWAATAGQYSGFLDASLPRYPSACGICLDRGRPQRFLVGRRFFEIMGIDAPLVTDGILLPWQVDEARGTIFIMAHGREAAFDQEDLRMMQLLADFAAMGVRQQKQQKLLVAQASAAAAAAMANDLAHKINNPLQSLTNVLYLASQEGNSESARSVGRQAMSELERLSALVKKLLELPQST